MLLQDKVAIVTGGNRGIGREIAIGFAEEGASIILVGRSKELLKKVENELLTKNSQVISIACDVTVEKEVNKMVETTMKRFGRIDILVNNAGSSGPTVAIENLEANDWDNVINSNLKSAFLCSKEVIPYMKKNGSGRIINMSSISGKRPLQFRSGYCASKMGIIGFTRTIATELGPYNITVNSICPGFVEGERVQAVISNQASVRGISKKEVEKEYKQASPLYRFTTPGDISATAVFLASDYAIGITGEDVNVSSGVVMY
ncbi:SDR family NAD(P)-dependent oxidoreductase [Lederbergia citrea]|uniref:SDR family NAD(P)-dependent oxidoreductase n=1 Tax=Lederbergia citrea TaxID=2833581 RepID=UPI001BC8E4EC|nr:SDR family NAD(P)-dependent oxidoreductase [Lederbergia citrea]MBS4178805.1 SDR family oxidoreductase [Lederbergia citrea]